jgi:hypothetical protein
MQRHIGDIWDLYDRGWWIVIPTNGDYFYIRNGWYGMPELQRVHFYRRNCNIDQEDEAVIWQQDTSGERKWQSYKVSELYADERKAKVALVVAQEKWLIERTAEVAEFRAKVEAENR